MAGKALSEETDSGEISRKMRDYLAEIYRLSDRHPANYGFVSTSALADLLDVSAPAVNRMVTKLRELGLLEHEPYQGIRLTAKGTREALKKLRCHRIAEAFLVNVMGFGWHEVHSEADRLSLGMSESVTERMLTMAGNPTTCPHGEPIPDAEGNLPDIYDILLTDAALEQEVTITRVRIRESERLEYMAALGLTPGTSLHVIHKAPFSGPIQLKIGREYRIIGHNLAEVICVKPQPDTP
ncbi:MAG: metal-dependent transcriptional regulator [Anaerolineaceae bacterium]|nr:metal-dependent transcriptional regulator [Anaerolineaceae bacterium]